MYKLPKSLFFDFLRTCDFENNEYFNPRIPDSIKIKLHTEILSFNKKTYTLSYLGRFLCYTDSFDYYFSSSYEGNIEEFYDQYPTACVGHDGNISIDADIYKSLIYSQLT